MRVSWNSQDLYWGFIKVIVQLPIMFVWAPHRYHMLTITRAFLIPVFFSIHHFSWAFQIPEVTLEALRPEGLRVLIPHQDKIQLVGFHANHNSEINSLDEGEINQDIIKPSDGRWVYYNPTVKLKPGDYISYWLFVQYDFLGFRKDATRWNVTELVENSESSCTITPSVVAGFSSLCRNTVILKDDFEKDVVDQTKWTVEHYIPFNSPDFEFVSYEKTHSIVKDGQLVIRLESFPSRRRLVDLSSGCTHPYQSNVECISNSSVFAPPIASGRLVSKLKFRYGAVEIKAKLPAGDWIFPEVYLEEENDRTKRLLIAYARGNAEFTDIQGKDYGSRVLFAGPVTALTEPSRSKYLSSKRSTDGYPFTKIAHIYTLHWTKDNMTFLIDGEVFGTLSTERMKEIHFSEKAYVRLVLGVGVGGVTDFPDGYHSGKFTKPWKDYQRQQITDFYRARDDWLQTWTSSELQVDHVEITTL